MNDDDLKARAIALYDRFTHSAQDRRAFMADMTRLAGSAAAAQMLVASIAADPAAAAIIAEDDKRLTAKMVHWPGADGRKLFGYMAIPRKHAKKPAAVLVIHENRGLQPYTRDVARRLAVEGFVGVALDFLAPAGGTPPNDEDAARKLIGALDLGAATADGVATIDWLAANRLLSGKVGAVGFCWGGAMANRLAVAAGPKLQAAVAFYGPPPPPSEAGKVKAALMLHYAGSDDRVNAGAGPWVTALQSAHADVRRYDYPGTQHAFHNDTSAARYDAAAAALAWDRTIAFFRAKLA
ncbi:dienelactone hydrolase family protein [Rhizorhabdus dicambivorans]|uniref:Dienelactone hydrolase family protein n=1 Tax=Rhizorhabdus dicambivorans TaxID=1850238 RepID=A0A2A4FZC7_9SPHN|nr:dienelactone hydrolase family protein [Rhizorhabdus dicambivorans]ATE65963.1 dienelactone hydrolase family protein [Rhizorhabdus dicambivorans]PCE43078.1 dienelactone hydrolase family protein [Rhizorhabdus dicambivorans]